MNVFLLLYPIKEFFGSKYSISDFNFELYNKTILERYKNNGYKIIVAMYPDKDVYGVDFSLIDKVVFTDITFEEHIAKKIYPNEILLLSQVENINKIVIGGFHNNDCVKRVGLVADKLGISTLIDIDMTDFFETVSRKDDYFSVGNYNPRKYFEYFIDINRIPPSLYDSLVDVYPEKIYGYRFDKYEDILTK